PTEHGVTARAVRAHFALVDICVTVLAILANIGKNGLHVACAALRLFMHAAQRVVRFVVVEFGNFADGSPRRSGVTVLAGHDQSRAVRALGGSSLRVCGRSRGGTDNLADKKSQPAHDPDDAHNAHLAPSTSL